MDIEEVLELADHLIFTKTGKHLDHLQQAISARYYTKLYILGNC
ncbi:ATPase [Planktothrix agardhii]|nr:ATPase [Planktothrix agardhii]